MAAGLRVGVNQALFYNSATYGTPTWVEITAAKDVTLNLQKSEAVVKARLSTWEQNLPAIKSLSIEWDMLGDTSLTPFNVIRDAFISDTLVDLAVCDDAAIATSGADYFRSECYIFEFTVEQKLEDAESVKCAAKRAYSTNAPAWTDVA